VHPCSIQQLRASRYVSLEIASSDKKANKKSRSAQLTELTVVGVAEISSACSRVRAIDAEKEPFVKRPDQQYRIAETRTRENDLRSKKSNGKDKEERERLVTAVI